MSSNSLRTLGRGSGLLGGIAHGDDQADGRSSGMPKDWCSLAWFMVPMRQGAQPHGSGLIAQGHGSHADVHLGEVLGTVVLRDAGLDVCLILTDQDEVGHPVSPGAAGEPVVVQRLNELGPGLWLVDDDEAPGLGVAAAGGQPGYVHQVGQGLPGHLGRSLYTRQLSRVACKASKSISKIPFLFCWIRSDVGLPQKERKSTGPDQ